MKCVVPEISWHNRDPVLCLDFQTVPSDSEGCRKYRLATGGTDSHVLIWIVSIETDGQVGIECVSDLTRHQKAVNVVRFSPNATFLASGDDEAAIWIWKRGVKDSADIFDDSNENKEAWITLHTLRGHIEDICDLGWSADSASLISGSVDNKAILWDIAKGKNVAMLSEHSGFVQGVAWDPKNQYVATTSTDRVSCLFNISTNKCVHKISKCEAVFPGRSDTRIGKRKPKQKTRMFHDDSLKTYSRRLCFSPDGELLLIPAGLIEAENGEFINVTYVFKRSAFNKPVMILPSLEKYTVAVRCCPVLFELRPIPRQGIAAGTESDCQKQPWEKASTVFCLPYRIVFAVASKDSVMLYDTQQLEPIGTVGNIHYTRLTDISWSSDGLILAISSTDGFCSFVTFEEGELGKAYVAPPPILASPNTTPIKSTATSPATESPTPIQLTDTTLVTDDSKLMNDLVLGEDDVIDQAIGDTGGKDDVITNKEKWVIGDAEFEMAEDVVMIDKPEKPTGETKLKARGDVQTLDRFLKVLPAGITVLPIDKPKGKRVPLITLSTPKAGNVSSSPLPNSSLFTNSMSVIEIVTLDDSNTGDGSQPKPQVQLDGSAFNNKTEGIAIKEESNVTHSGEPKQDARQTVDAFATHAFSKTVNHKERIEQALYKPANDVLQRIVDDVIEVTDDSQSLPCKVDAMEPKEEFSITDENSQEIREREVANLVEELRGLVAAGDVKPEVPIVNPIRQPRRVQLITLSGPSKK